MNKVRMTAVTSAALLVAGAAEAATTGTLNLRGTVNASYSIQVTEDAGGANLNLDILNGETDRVVADSREKSNNPTGYKISASSTNGGLLKNGTVDQVAYTIKYGSSSDITLTTTPQTVYTSPALTSPADNTQSVSVSFPAKPTALAGIYTDTVTLSIGAP